MINPVDCGVINSPPANNVSCYIPFWSVSGGVREHNGSPRQLERLLTLLAVLRINMHRKIRNPVHPRRLGIAVVIHIVDVPLPNMSASRPPLPEVHIRERLTKLSISPHAISLRSSPLLPPVRNPSLPASNSRHSVARARKTVEACEICCGEQPNMMHLPMRARSSAIHRDGGRGGSFVRTGG